VYSFLVGRGILTAARVFLLLRSRASRAGYSPNLLEIVFSEVGIQDPASTCRLSLGTVNFCTLDAGLTVTRYWALNKHAI